MTDELPVLKLKKGEERRLLAGHLWIYSNEVDTSETPLGGFSKGEQVAVYSNRGQCVAMATINPHSLICARVFSHTPGQRLDTALLAERFTTAMAWRDRIYPEGCYRLVHGEGDWLPGLIIDRYGEHLVVQANTAGMSAVLDDIVSALDQVLKPTSIFLRNTSGALALEGLEQESRTLLGVVPDTARIIENGLTFEVPLQAGQKTGWFYDHRDNRIQMQAICADKRVLDAYCYLGAWGMNALAAGASSVVAVDSSEKSLEGAAVNAKLNGFEDRWQGQRGDVADALRAFGKEKFDVIVLDPPAFIQRAKDKRKGQEKYLSINSLAAGLLADGGVLVSGSCSHHLSADQLQKTVLSAGRKRNRIVQVVGTGRQSRDHPVHAAIPETAYLKTVSARFIR